MPNDGKHRDGNGRYLRTIEVAERDAEAARLRSSGYSYQRIADTMGYSHKKDASDAVQRCLKETVQEAGEQVRAMELARLDAELVRLNGMEDVVARVLKRKHITVSNGRVISLPDDEGVVTPLEDDAPILNAVDRLLKIEDSRRRNGKARRELLGLDEPVKAHITGSVQYEIVGVDMSKLQ